MKIKLVIGLMMIGLYLQNQLHTGAHEKSANKAHAGQKTAHRNEARSMNMIRQRNKQKNKQRSRSRQRNRSHKVFSTVEKNQQQSQQEEEEGSSAEDDVRFGKKGYTDSQGKDYKSNDKLLNNQKEIYGDGYKDNDKKKEIFNKGKSAKKLDEEMKEYIKKNKLTDQQKIEKFPNMFDWIYMSSPSEMENQNKLNSQAQTKFVNSPDGSDDIKDLLYEGEMMVRINYYSAQFSDPDLKPYYVRLNDRNLYASSSQVLGYRGVNASIAIKNVYDPNSDDVRMGQCCQQVGTVKVMLFGDVNNQAAYNCFAVEDYTAKISWTICNTDNDAVSDLRQYVILAVIKYGLQTFGIFGMEELMKFQKIACERPTGWNYNFQSRWPCMCPEGMAQSPIDIVTKDAINNTRIGADFRRWDQKVTSYTQMKTPQENYAVGTFGTLIVKDKSRKKTQFSTTEIRFKFPSEHRVNDKEFPGEMQIISSNGDTRVIVSVFITNDENDLSMMKKVFQTGNKKEDMDAFDTNMSGKQYYAAVAGGNGLSEISQLFDDQAKIGDKFLQNMTISGWDKQDKVNAEYDKKPGEKCVSCDGKFKLFDIFQQKDTLTRSFWTYLGSDTKPACKEDVQWIIMKDPFAVSSSQLTYLKERSLVATNPNTRRLMPLAGREILSYDECPRFKFDIPPATVNNDAALLKAKVKKHWYAIVYPGTKTMFDDDTGKFVSGKTKHFIKTQDGWEKYVSKRNVDHLDDSDYYSVESMDEAKMDQAVKSTPGMGQIRQDLRWQLGKWLVDNRERIMNDQLKKIDNKYGRDAINGDTMSF